MAHPIDALGLLAVEDAARALGVSRYAIHAAVRRGRLRCGRTAGGRCLFLPRDLEEYRASRRQSPHAR